MADSNEPMIEMFQAIGHPKYSDVSGLAPVQESYDEARADGEKMLRVGNWTHFQITKWFVLDPRGGT